MKALILSGGFAKRMFPLTKDKPKALLPLKGKPMLEHVLKKIEPLSEISQVFVSVNKKFEQQFTEFLKGYETQKLVRLVVENSLEEGQKLGSVGSIRHFMETERVEEPLLIMAADNVLDSGLFGLMLLYKRVKSPVVGVFDVQDKSLASKYGIVQLDEKERITGFQEKPSEPASTLASTGIYVLTLPALKRISGYLESHQGDRMGDFISWLSSQEKVYGFKFQGKWFDIGSPEEYVRAEKEMD